MNHNAPLSYYDVGEEDAMSPPVLLLHGFCESKEAWKGFEEALLPDHRVIIPDLPGFGNSDPEPEESSIEYYADKVNELLQFLQIPGAIIIGHSLGGYVALALQEKYTEKVHALGLFHSTAFPDTEERKKNRDKTISFLNRNGMEKFASIFVDPLFYEENRSRLKNEINFVKDLVRNTPTEGAVAGLEAMRDRKDRKEILENTKVPVLFIIGKEDQAVPLEDSMEQSELPPQNHVYVLEDTGHMGMFEQREKTMNIVKSFADEIKQRVFEV